MKICITFCVLFVVHLSYGKSINNGYYESGLVKEGAVCKSVEFDNGNVEFNHFVSNQMRGELCAKKIHNYNSTGRMQSKYLGEEYNYNSHQNPCRVVCRYDPLHESIIDDHHVVEEHKTAEYYEGEVVAPFSYAEYRNLPFFEVALAENTKCGAEHICDASGCCVQSVVHPEPETHEPKEPVEPHVEPEPHEPHVPEPEPHDPHVPETDPHVPEEPKEPEVPHEPHTPEEHKEVPEQPKEPEVVPEKVYSCSEAGVFADPEDESSFFRCYLKSAHIKCAEGLLFDKESHQCYKPIPPETDFNKLVSCSKEGFFRNPYDCKRFYRCYFNDEVERTEGFLRIGFFQCRDDMVFDETAHTCVLAATTDICQNKQVPHEPEDVKEDKEPEYHKILKCEHEGYFRNPYECHRFYRCYYNHHSETTLNLALYVCGHGKVFDEVSKNCVPQERTSECLNKQLPVETHYRQ